MYSKLRTAQTDDSEQIAEVHIASWRSPYIGQVPAEYLATLSVEKRITAWKEVFAKADLGKVCVIEISTAINENSITPPKIVGFISYGKSRDENQPPKVGEIYAIYLLEEFKGQRLGIKLCEHAITELSEQGFTEIALWVLESNTKARNFYEGLGFSTDGLSKVIEIGGEELKEVRYRKICVAHPPT